MTRINFLVLMMVALGLTAMAVNPASAQIKTEKSLYVRLGGYDAIAAVVDDFIGRLLSDSTMTRFFTSLSTDSKKRLRQLVVEQICEVAGGPCFYTGRDMKTAHAGLGITEDIWNAGVKHLAATLDKFKVPQKEKDEVIGAIASLKKDIVETEK
jgi:hemoglobin